jgi:EAL domain-containing protein (putative c-di-GMP-specific phosphodiesterase class I)
LLPQASPTTRAVLAERFVAQALDDWSDLAGAGLGSRIAIGASFDALANGNLMEVARRQRPKSDLWPGLILEISEHEVIQDINLAHEIATQLRIHDITLGIDNFGAGFSSFERLRELPFSELKLHPGFVAGCGRDDKNAGICRAAIDLAHRFGIVAVADGLESEADVRALQSMGCDVGQGPLLAEPMPKSELMDVFGERARTKHAWIG